MFKILEGVENKGFFIFIIYITKNEKTLIFQRFLVFLLEAPIGIEPMNQSFADSCLTAWLRRQILERETGLKPATSALARQRSIN